MIENVIKHEQFTIKSKKQYWTGCGRRKRSVARVRIMKGTGQIIINERNTKEFFTDTFAQNKIEKLLDLVGLKNKLNISVKVAGGGRIAALDALKLGLARAIIKYDESLRTTLKKTGLLTRDPREKERKKPGLKRARRAPQWQKR
jgi:small subunit ribosomal protein S9